MKDEICAAADFLTRLIGRQNDHLTESKLQQFRHQLDAVLHRKFKNHWFPDKPSRGQAFRCIRVNENIRRDSILETVCQEIGLSFADLIMPAELTLWIDPEEVTCRFGEHKGSYCIVAQFKDGNKENYVDQINVDELEQKSLERSKQASFDLVNARKRKARIMAAKNLQMNAGMYAGAGGQDAYGMPISMAMTTASYYTSSPVTGFYSSAKYAAGTSYSPSGSAVIGVPYTSSPTYSVSPTSRSAAFRSGTAAYGSSSFGNNGSAGLIGSGSGKYGGASSARGLGSAFNSASASYPAYSNGNGNSGTGSSGGGGSSSSTGYNSQQGDRFHYVKSSLKA